MRRLSSEFELFLGMSKLTARRPEPVSDLGRQIRRVYEASEDDESASDSDYEVIGDTESYRTPRASIRRPA